MASNRVVGLDIGSSSLKAAQVRREADGSVVVEKTHSQHLPRGIVSNGRVVEDKGGQLSTHIADFWKQAGFSTQEVIVGVGNAADALARPTTLPQMLPDDIDEALPHLLKTQPSLSQINVDDFDIAFYPTAEVMDGSKKRLRGLVFAARKEATEGLAQVIKDAGLKMVGLTLTPLAMLRSMAAPYTDAKVVHAIVDIGATLTTVILHEQGVPASINIIESQGGDDITLTLTDTLGNDNVREVDEKKRNARATDGDLYNAIDFYEKGLAAAIKGAVDSFFRENEHLEAGIASVTLMGGGCLIHGFQNKLAAALNNIDVSWGTYDPSIRSAKGGVPERFNSSGQDLALAIGLAASDRL